MNEKGILQPRPPSVGKVSCSPVKEMNSAEAFWDATVLRQRARGWDGIPYSSWLKCSNEALYVVSRLVLSPSVTQSAALYPKFEGGQLVSSGSHIVHSFPHFILKASLTHPIYLPSALKDVK